MRAVVQRVASARVTSEAEELGAIGPGLLVYVAVGPGDGGGEVGWLAHQLATLRLFPDASGRPDRSLLDVFGEALLVSQFTLYADTRRGRRPSFTGAAGPDVAEPLIRELAAELRRLGISVASGRFGADMQVASINDGPITILLDSEDVRRSRRG